MRTPLALALAIAASLAALAARPAPVDACGGCFSPPETVTSVESHRMVVSLSASRSILWDQIRYTGAPEDFVWVLPVPMTEPVVAVADDLFFAELEAWTAPQVFGPQPPQPDCPPLDCAPCPGGEQDAAASGPDVDVYREEVVGPYETVVIGSDDPGALAAWLGEHGYNIPESTAPILQHYIDLKMKFVALRLSPNQGVSAMQPIRVEYPGYMATFPLRMVTVGAYASLQMTLWVLAEQRYRPLNYADVVIDAGELVWDFDTSRSNYAVVLRDTIDQAGGRAWVTQAAQPLDDFFITSAEVTHVRADIPYPFLTRLSTDMLVDHLDADLELGPSDRGWLSNTLFAERFVNPPPPPPCPTSCQCGRPIDEEEDLMDRIGSCGGCGTSGVTRGVPWVALGAGALVIVSGLSRRARRRRVRPDRA